MFQMNSMASTDTVTCRLCRRQFSKYTCPTCNVPYCSLTCFRSEAHSQCSETFYKKEVESDIRTEPSKTAQERQRMMELLKRFEEDQGQIETFEGDDEGESEESDISRRLQDVDLESTSPDHIWSLLNPAEREKFLKVMEDPSSDLALHLLTSEELESEKQEPWWTESAAAPENGAVPSTSRRGVPPAPIQVPLSLMSSNRSGPSLVYNICALHIVYAYTTRHLSISPLSAASDSDMEAARVLISQLTPFLTSRTSKTLHPSLDSAITDVSSRLPADSATPQLFALLLRDTAALLRPALLVDEADIHVGPHARALRALGDLHALFRMRAHVAHKIMFYAASIETNSREAALELERAAQVREADQGMGVKKTEWERLGERSGQQRRNVEIEVVDP
ncbi:hypothetical protein B0H11DRAFT_1849854 [Mycena galericulata]|nr:hypothetical protein B0H11DRAFT_1849854 [Mycena galericulata]